MRLFFERRRTVPQFYHPATLAFLLRERGMDDYDITPVHGGYRVVRKPKPESRDDLIERLEAEFGRQAEHVFGKSLR
jgi:hypothetical protein